MSSRESPGNRFAAATSIVPFVREADFAVRGRWGLADRRLLDYLLIHVESGELTLEHEGARYDVEPGCVVLVQPGDLHAFDAVADTVTPYAHLDVFYNPLREASFPTRSGQVDLSGYEQLLQPRLDAALDVWVPPVFHPSRGARFRELLLRMVGTWQSPDPIDRLEAQALATDLIVQILRDFGSTRRPSAAHPPDSLDWVTSYLSLHLGEPITVAAMARRAHLSPSHFSAVFGRRYGMSPHRFLTRLRIEHAQSLLAGGDTSLSEIGALCGFADVQHFVKAFKRVTGETPGAYRTAVRA